MVAGIAAFAVGGNLRAEYALALSGLPGLISSGTFQLSEGHERKIAEFARQVNTPNFG